MYGRILKYFTCDLFSESVNSSDYTVSKYIMINELEAL
jgi:hypothetical protein